MIPRPRPGKVRACRELCPTCLAPCALEDWHQGKHSDGRHKWQLNARGQYIVTEIPAVLSKRALGRAHTRKAARDTSAKEWNEYARRKNLESRQKNAKEQKK